MLNLKGVGEGKLKIKDNDKRFALLKCLYIIYYIFEHNTLGKLFYWTFECIVFLHSIYIKLTTKAL